SIALGVATLVATQALNQSLKAGVQEGVNPLAGMMNLVISNGQSGVSQDLAEEVRKAGVPGVDAVTPFVLWRISLADLDNKIIWLLGVEPPGKKDARNALDPGLEGVKIQLNQPQGLLDRWKLLLNPPALVTPNLAEELERKSPGSRGFRLRNAGRTPTITRVGTIDFSASPLPFQGSSLVAMSIQDASAICFPERPGTVHQIGIGLAPGTDARSVKSQLQKIVGDRADVQSIDTSQNLVSDVTAGLEIGFAVGGAGALVVGLFLVFNALSVSVAERRHDIGILRSVGATRGQIASIFFLESLVMGVTGSALGLPLGWLLARAAVGPMASTISDLLVPIDQTRVELSGWLIVLALLSGSLVAVMAAMVPAIQAASEEPADAVRRVPRRNLFIMAILQVAGMVALLILGFLFAYYRQSLPHRAGMFAGIVCLLLGGLISTPLLASLVGKLVQPFFRHFLGLEGRLAADNMVRTPGRTGLVIAALAATGALLVQTAGFLTSSREEIREWIEERVAADLFLTCGSPVTSGGAALSMQESFAQNLQQFPEIEAVMPVRFLRLDYRPQDNADPKIVFLVAIDARAFHGAPSRNQEQLTKLQEKGKVVVSENFGALYGVRKGDPIIFPGKDKPIRAEVADLVKDYTWNRGTIFMDRQWFQEEFQDNQVDVFDLYVKPGTNVASLKQNILQRFGAEHALFAASRKEVHQEVNLTLQRIYSIAYAQQMVVGMVAMLGVISALFISVLQRKRELGLLRAIGASRGQILRSVLAEATLMGIVGSLVGFGIGLLLEWYVLDIMLLDESGFLFPLRIPWMEAGLVTLFGVTLATLAGLWPAYHATTLRIPDAIAYE
ncbi:MAG: FtsX-like permease family protein, partial [Gemmataceae bacterium]